MDRAEALRRLRALKGDVEPVAPETAHSDADDILLDLINDDAIRAAYEAVPKWYA